MTEEKKLGPNEIFGELLRIYLRTTEEKDETGNYYVTTEVSANEVMTLDEEINRLTVALVDRITDYLEEVTGKAGDE